MVIQMNYPHHECISNHIYKTAALWALGCDVGYGPSSQEAFTSLRVPNVVDHSICELLYCAGEPVHFQPLFQEHLSLLH